MACNVVFCVNAKFGALVPVVIESILLNSSVECHFYVVYSGISEETEKECELTIKGNFIGRPKQEHHVTFVKFDPQKALSTSDGKVFAEKFRGGYDAYTRIFLPELLKEYNVDQCLYLDVDLVADKNIDELLLAPENIEVIGGVKDRVTNASNKYFTENYINSGVLAMNLIFLRKFNFTKKCCDFILDHQPSPPDQEIINSVLSPEQKAILPNIFNECSSDRKFYNQAAIIHFTGSYKPWMIQTRWRAKKFYWYKYYLANKRTLKGESVSREQTEKFMKRRLPFRALYNLALEFNTRVLGRKTQMDRTFENR